MRVFIAISIVVASVSSASAQFAMDHGHAADAARAARAAQAAADAKAAAIASGAPLSPSQQTNFYVGSGGTVKIAPRTAEELKADEAAQAAWQQATETYLAYRRAGGVSQSSQSQLFAGVAQAVQQNNEAEAAQRLNQLLEPDDPPQFTTLIRQLQAVLAGVRDPALAADPELSYGNAAELQFLLEALGQGNPEGGQE